MSTLHQSYVEEMSAFVTLLSILGLNASPLKNVTRSTWLAYFCLSRYEFTIVTKRAAPPAGSRVLYRLVICIKKGRGWYVGLIWYTSLK